MGLKILRNEQGQLELGACGGRLSVVSSAQEGLWALVWFTATCW
jgi:hypothetical protein